MPYNFPDAPTLNEEYISGDKTFVWNGTVWLIKIEEITGAVIVSDTPPLTPTANTLWWDSDSGDLFIYYEDVDSAQWVQINVVAPPTTGVDEAPTDGLLYGRQSAAWAEITSTGSGGGITEAEADARYLQLIGGSLGGHLKLAYAGWKWLQFCAPDGAMEWMINGDSQTFRISQCSRW